MLPMFGCLQVEVQRTVAVRLWNSNGFGVKTQPKSQTQSILTPRFGVPLKPTA